MNDKQFEDYYNQMLRGMASEFNASFEGRFQRDTKDVLGFRLHWWPGTRLGLTLMIRRVLYVGPILNPVSPAAGPKAAEGDAQRSAAADCQNNPACK